MHAHEFACWTAFLKLSRWETRNPLRLAAEDPWHKILKQDAADAAMKCGCANFPKKAVAPIEAPQVKCSQLKLVPFFGQRKKK